MTTKLPVEIEDIQSWPEEFRDEAFKHKTLVVSYHQECHRISQLGEDDIHARIYPPRNVYGADYRALADHLEEILLRHHIVGYHCTRLTAREIQNIKDDGLKILTGDLVQRRLDQTLEDGYLTKIQMLELKNCDILKDNLDNRNRSRTEMIWFCANRTSLKEYRRVYRLLRSWGGEAIYRGHENDDPLSQKIRKIGTPCIIKCALPFSDAKHFYNNFSERFLSHLVTDAVDDPEPQAIFEMYVKRNLAPTEVLVIYDYSHPEFERLLDYDNWKYEFPLVDND